MDQVFDSRERERESTFCSGIIQYSMNRQFHLYPIIAMVSRRDFSYGKVKLMINAYFFQDQPVYNKC